METPTIEEQVKRLNLLADALESGVYKQTKNRLRDPSGFCCLGVACDVYRTTTGAGKWETFRDVEGSVDYFETPDGERARTLLPHSVVQWFGFDDADPYLHGVKEEQDQPVAPAMTGMNDDAGWTFHEIATALREHADYLVTEARLKEKRAAV